jgi:carbon-monoxide dehydrogenase iron sulfur subunit
MAKIVVATEGRCLGCKSCEIACAMAHSEAKTLAEAVRADVPPQSRVHVEPLDAGGLPLQCRHCEDAPCVAVCPTGAIRRASDDAPVLLDAEACIGCRFCMLVCPFGVIDLSRDGKAMIKCDLCIERTEAGEEPACVAACPTGGLKFVEIDAWLRTRRREAAARIAGGLAPADQEARP